MKYTLLFSIKLLCVVSSEYNPNAEENLLSIEALYEKIPQKVCHQITPHNQHDLHEIAFTHNVLKY